jgi:hypothetical protein
MVPTIRNCDGLLQDGHEQVADANEKFDTYLLVSNIGSILKKQLCSDCLECGEREPHTNLLVIFIVCDISSLSIV